MCKHHKSRFVSIQIQVMILFICSNTLQYFVVWARLWVYFDWKEADASLQSLKFKLYWRNRNSIKQDEYARKKEFFWTFRVRREMGNNRQ